MATFNGTNNDDIIRGLVEPDYIYGYEGNDRLFGYGSRDFIFGGPGNDYLEGGEETDSLFDGPGDDNLVGGENIDIFEFSGGLDYCQDLGFGGNDILRVTDSFVNCYVRQGLNWTTTEGVLNNGADTINNGTVAIFSEGGSINLALAGGEGSFSIYNIGAVGTTFVGSKNNATT